MSTVDDLTHPQLPTLLLLFAQIDQKMKLSAGWKCVTHALHSASANRFFILVFFFKYPPMDSKRSWRDLLLRSLKLCVVLSVCLSACLLPCVCVCLIMLINERATCEPDEVEKRRRENKKNPNKSNLLLWCLMSSSANVLARPWWCWWAWITK